MASSSRSGKEDFKVAAAYISKELKSVQSDTTLPGISCGLVDGENLFTWEVMLMLHDEMKYYGGGNFRALLSFPYEYPNMPPKMIFQKPIPFHPNIYPETGEICISILHPPGEDVYGYEHATERWNSARSISSVLISVISLFDEPNDESPANIEAAKLLREERDGKGREFGKRARRSVRESLEVE